MIKVMIQTEAGSAERRLYDEKTLAYQGTRRMARPFPYPYGFILGTSAADGDCVDCYIITTDTLEAGSIVECEAVGLMEQDEDGEIDHKVLAALPGQRVELSQGLLQELREFIYALIAPFPDAHIQIGQLLPREAALQHIQQFRDQG